jgi:signal transduction histidine kinase
VALARDLSERLAADAALQASDAALRAAHERLLLVDDRERIARDLHDMVIQRVFAAGLVLQSLASGADERTSARLQHTIDELDETIRDLRLAVFSLTAQQAPPGLRGRLLDVVTDATPALRSDPLLEFNGAIDALPERIAEHLVSTLHDALSNLAHRGQDCTIWVTVSVGDDVHLRVDDDATGPPDDLIGAHGAAILASRAEHLGGSCVRGPRSDGGTRLDWRVPLGVG